MLVLNRNQAVVRDEGEIREDRAGRDNRRARYDDARVRFLLDVHADVRYFVRRTIAIDRWMNDRVIDEGHAFLTVAVPAARVLLVRRIEVGVRAKCREE